MTNVIDQIADDSSARTDDTNAGDLLNSLVGDGKKFRTVEDLAKSKVESDSFIEQLKRENAEARRALAEAENKLKDSAGLERLVDSLKNNQGKDGSGNQPTPPVSLEDLQKLVRAVTTEEKQKELRSANKSEVDKALIKAKGTPEKAAEFVREQAVKLGLSPTQVRELSETSPAAFITLFGLQVEQDRKPILRPGPALNSEAALREMDSSGKRTYSWYEAKRKEMGAAKFFGDFALQRQKQQDMRAMGAAFYDKEE